MADTMRAGYAAVDVTHPVGVELTDFVAREGPSTGVHDPLYARALVFEDGGARAALVACDLVGLGREGPIDPLVSVVRVDGESGEPVATVVGYACHATAAGSETRLVNADYPGYEVEIAHRYYGLPSSFAPEAGERLVEAARRLLKRGVS